MNDIKEILFNKTSKDINQDRQLLFEQYKLFLELTDKTSERRNTTNNFYLTINGALIAAIISLLTNISPNANKSIWISIAVASGIAFCWAWRRMIFYYKNLNSGKFHIIQLVEERLPVNLYNSEWKYLKEIKKHKSFSDTEMIVPVIFFTLYFSILLFNYELSAFVSISLPLIIGILIHLRCS